MSRDIAPFSGGSGGALVPTQGGGESRSMPSRADLARRGQADVSGSAPALTDAELFEGFETQLVEALAGRGIRDPSVASKVLAVAQDLNRAAMKSKDDFDLAELADAFVHRLAQAGISDARTVSVAVAVGVSCLQSLVGEADDARDEADLIKARSILTSRWGANYRANVRAIRNYINSELPVSLSDAIWNGRDVDGRAIANSVETMLWLEQLALARRSGGGGSIADLKRERDEIEGVMRTDRRRYNKSTELQGRYLEILELLGEEARKP